MALMIWAAGIYRLATQEEEAEIEAQNLRDAEAAVKSATAEDYEAALKRLGVKL